MNQNLIQAELIIVDTNPAVTSNLLAKLNTCSQITKVKILILHNGITYCHQSKFPSLNIWEKSVKKNLGFARAVNSLLKRLVKKNTLVIIINNDTLVAKDFISQCLKYYTTNQETVFSPITLMANNRKKIDSAGIQYFTTGVAYSIREKPFFKQTINGVCLCIPKKIIKLLIKIYGYFFDEDYFSYVEDLELWLRLKKIGITTLVYHNFKIFHFGSTTWGKRNATLLFHVWKNSLLTLILHWPFYLIKRNCLFLLIGQFYFLIYSLVIGKPLMVIKIYYEIFGKQLKKALYKRKRIIILTNNFPLRNKAVEILLTSGFIKKIFYRIKNRT